MKTTLSASSEFEDAVSGARKHRTPRPSRRVVGVFCAIAFAVSAHAQNNSTVTVDGVSSNLAVSFSGHSNLLQVINGGVLTNSGTFTSGSASYNTAVVQGDGSVLTNTTLLYVGFQGVGNNTLIVSNQAELFATGLNLGFDLTGVNTNNGALFTGFDTRATFGGSISLGRGPSWNWLTVSNGAVLTITTSGTTIGASGNPSNNRILVTGSNSKWISAGINETRVGMYGQSNSLTVSDGAFMSTRNTLVSEQAGSANNTVLVTGKGSILTNVTSVVVGYHGTGNRLVISNGGTVYAGAGAEAVAAGFFTDGSGSILVTGTGSLLQAAGGVAMGSNGAWKGSGQLLVTDGGTVEATQLRGGLGGTGTITNRGGVFQFALASPTINPLTAGSIVVTNGTISFRGITTASPNVGGTSLTNITFQGNNTFQLNNATNTSIASYTFDSVANTGTPTNYQRLALANGARWQSTSLAIGSGGALIGNGTVASANVTNQGSIAPGFSAGLLTFTNNLVLGASSLLEMEIGGTDAVDYDRLIVGGSVTLTGALAVTPINSFSPAVGDTFTLIDAQAIFGEFAGLTNNQFFDASQNGMSAFFRIQYDTDNGDVLLIATIPEPSTVIWFAGAGLALLFRRRGGRVTS